MKIALNEERVAYADDSAVVYEETKSALKATWDMLAEMYTSDAEKQHFEEIQDFDVFKSVAFAKAEMETGQSVGSAAVDKKTCVSSDSSTLTLCEKAIDEMQRIFAKCIVDLEEAFHNEQAERGEYEFSFYDGLVRKQKTTTLRCSVAYKNVTVIGSVGRDWDRRLKSALVRKVAKRCVVGDVEINVAVSDSDDQKNAICDYVVACFEQGDDVADVVTKVQQYFAFYLSKFVFCATIVARSDDRVFATRDGNFIEIGFQKTGFLAFVFNGRRATLGDVQNALAF